jgi:putative ABC transport system permease protein
MRRNPGFTAVAVITLALGIGANTAIFSVVNAVLLKAPPFQDPAHLVQLFETEQAPGNFPLNSADYLDWQAQNRSFAASSLYGWGNDTSVSGSGEPELGVVTPKQANFFDVLGVKPLFGRTFAPGDGRGKHNVAVLSYGFWQRHFAGARDVFSKAIKLKGETYNVIGIMPRWFRFPGGGCRCLASARYERQRSRGARQPQLECDCTDETRRYAHRGAPGSARDFKTAREAVSRFE